MLLTVDTIINYNVYIAANIEAGSMKLMNSYLLNKTSIQLVAIYIYIQSFSFQYLGHRTF